MEHPDIAAVDILLAAIAQGRASALNERLEIEHGIAHGVWGYLLPRHRASLASIGLTPNHDTATQCLTIVFEELERCILDGITEDELERTRHAVLADFLFGAETVDGVAHDAAWYSSYLGSPEMREVYRQRLNDVSAADVQRVANAYLHPKKCALSFLAPDLSFDLARALTLHDPSPEAIIHHPPTPAIEYKERPPSRPPAAQRRYVLDNGATVVLIPDKSPVAAFRLTCLGGGLTETTETAGMTSAWSHMLLSGAGNYDAAEFARVVERLAGELSGVGGRNTLGITGSFPAEHLLDGIGLCGELLRHPHFDREQWHHVHDELREHLLTIEDRPSEIAARALSARLWKGGPWAVPGTVPSRLFVALTASVSTKIISPTFTATTLSSQ